MNGVSSVGFLAQPANSKRFAAMPSPQIHFGDEEERLWSRKSLIRTGHKEIIGLIFGVVLAPLAHPAKEVAKNLLWKADDKTPGVVSRKVHEGTRWVRNLFSKKTKGLEEQLEEQEKQLRKKA
jgi:hypothetical protein